MKNLFQVSTATILVCLIYGCYPEKAKQIKQIGELENRLLSKAKEKSIDEQAVLGLLDRYEAFANRFPSDSLAPEYLFKRAQFLQYMHFYTDCITAYQRIVSEYPNHRHGAFSMFVQGFLYDSELQLTDSARLYYKTFLKKHPSHPLAKDVDLLLLQLGKSPDELVAGFRSSADSASLEAKP
jgi:hypothetical protein